MSPSLVQAAEISWSPERVVQRAQGACELVLRQPVGALLGRPLEDVLAISPDRAAQLDQLAQKDASAVEFLVRTEGAGGTLRLVLGQVDGRCTAGVTDLTAQLQGAPPLQISGLSSSLSHEIRNPLSSVKMAVQTLARNTGLSERDQRRLAIANREIRTMERMLGLLSEYGRELGLSAEPTPLRVLVQEAAALIEPELAERRTQLELDVTEDDPKVRADSLRLRLVLAQLLLNVAMGHPEGGKVRVVLRARPEGGGVLEVHDPNAAVPPEERATLFEPFGSRLARGAGLSLAALQRVLKAHGGEVTAEGSSYPGTRFTLTFPS